MGSDYEEDSKISKYNSAVAQLYRLDHLWQSAHHHSRSGQLMKWNWDLDAIWRELAGDAKEDDLTSYYQISAYINPNINNRLKLYSIFEYKEIFLRRLLNKQGKGTAYVNPDDDLLEE